MVREVGRQEKKEVKDKGKQKKGKERTRVKGRGGERRDLERERAPSTEPPKMQKGHSRLEPWTFIVLFQKLHPNHSLFYSLAVSHYFLPTPKGRAIKFF